MIISYFWCIFFKVYKKVDQALKPLPTLGYVNDHIVHRVAQVSKKDLNRQNIYYIIKKITIDKINI